MERVALIEFKDVTMVNAYDRNKIMLEKVNFKIYEGDLTSVIGVRDSGKSWIPNLIAGFREPNEGQIIYRGKPIDQIKKKEWNDYIGKISYIFQNNALFDSMTVYENVAMPLKYATKLSKSKIDEKVMARIEQTELTEVAHKYPSEITAIMQKRTALARALVTDPRIMIFDEPTTGQDPIQKNAILSMVAEYQKRFGFTALLTSHEIPDVYFISNRILVLYDCKIIFQGKPEDFDALDNPFRQELISSLEILEQEITGLYSRRQFKVRYQSDLSQRHPDAYYAAAVFAIDDLDDISENLGHDVSQQIVRSLGSYINKHFGAVGGFSFRQTINEYATVLPYSNLEESEWIMKNFTKDFRKHGVKKYQEYEIWEIDPNTENDDKSGEYVEFSILTGLAQGKHQIEIESVMEFARYNQKEIARFRAYLP